MNSQTQARQILESLGLPVDGLIFATRQGVANDTWLTPDYVVRISKDPEYLEDLFTESVAAPAAIRAGVSTPALVAMGLPTHSVWKRVDGVTLADAFALTSPEAFFISYGRMLRTIHEVPCPSDPHGYLDEPWVIDLDELLLRADRAGYRDPIERLFARAEPAPKRCFVHQDLHAENVMVDTEESPVVLDWGDAGFGDPAVDFRFVPIPFLDHVLAGYCSDDPHLRARILIHQWDQHFYAEDLGRSYGRWGDSRPADLIEQTLAP